jgi:hypothetical protein
MEATVTPTHTRPFRRTAVAATVGAAIGALITIGITALLTHDESNANRPAVVPAAAGHNLPVTADAAERWLTLQGGGLEARRSVPRSADAAEHWVAVSRAPSGAHLSADATEYWASADNATAAPSGRPFLSADAAEHWLASN